jgi:hypothetical protein
MSKKTNSLITSVLGIAALSSSVYAATPDAEHDARFITIHTAWTHWSAEEQKNLIDESAKILEGTLSTVSKAAPGAVPTFSNTFLPTSVLDKLTTETQKSLEISKDLGVRDFLPTGFMLWAGGSSELGILAHGKFSLDIGLVLVPSKETIIDTFHQLPTQTKYKTTMAVVGFPHGYLGLGAGVGAGFSAGASLIWGDLNNASDFGGAVVGGGVDIKALGGLDGEFALVKSLNAQKTYKMGTVEFDWGPEANASVDGESGVIEPLEKVLEKLHLSEGTAQVIANAVTNAGANLNAATPPLNTQLQ